MLLETQLLGEVVVACLVDLLVGSALIAPVGLLDLVEVFTELHKTKLTHDNIFYYYRISSYAAG